MGLRVKATAEEREQLDALKAHQATVREHKRTKSTVDALTQALASAQTEHAAAATEREIAKSDLLAALQDA